MNTKTCGLLFCSLLFLLWPKSDAESQKDDLPRLPGATLLIGSISPEALAVTTPNETLRLLPESGQPRTGDWTAIYPTITRDGKIVACARLKVGSPRRVGVVTYSLLEKKWSEYTEGEFAGTIAISNDGSKLAFAGNEEPDTSRRLHIIDLGTKQESIAPEVMFPVGALSWCPNGKHLAYESNRAQSGSGHGKSEIRVFEIETGKTWKIADGELPAWAPSGDWIVYVDFAGPKMKYVAVHPNGTGAKVLVELSRGRHFVGPPVWSPDSKRLLLNEIVNEEGGIDVYLLDFATLKLSRKFKNTLPIMGWAEVK